MAAAGINLVLIEEEDQFISIASVAMGYVWAPRLVLSLQASVIGGGCEQRSLMR